MIRTPAARTPDLKIFRSLVLAERYLRLLGKRLPGRLVGRARSRKVECVALEGVLSRKELNLLLASPEATEHLEDLAPLLKRATRGVLEDMQANSAHFNFHVEAIEALRHALKIRRRLHWFEAPRARLVDYHGLQALLIARLRGFYVHRALHGRLEDLPRELAREVGVKVRDYEGALFFYADTTPRLTLGHAKWLYAAHWELIEEFKLPTGRLYVVIPQEWALKSSYNQVHVVLSGETETDYEWHTLFPAHEGWTSVWGPPAGIRVVRDVSRRALETGFQRSGKKVPALKGKRGEDKLAIMERAVQEYKERGFDFCQYSGSLTHTSRSMTSYPHPDTW